MLANRRRWSYSGLRRNERDEEMAKKAKNEEMKAIRRNGRDGQIHLRSRGGFHEKRGYQRPQQARWA